MKVCNKLNSDGLPGGLDITHPAGAVLHLLDQFVHLLRERGVRLSDVSADVLQKGQDPDVEEKQEPQLEPKTHSAPVLQTDLKKICGENECSNPIIPSGFVWVLKRQWVRYRQILYLTKSSPPLRADIDRLLL